MTCYFGGNHPAVLDEWVYVNLFNNNEHPCIYHRERIIKGYLNSWRYVEMPCIDTCICYCCTVCIKITNPEIALIPSQNTENNTESLNKRSDVLCMFYIIYTTYLYIWLYIYDTDIVIQLYILYIYIYMFLAHIDEIIWYEKWNQRIRACIPRQVTVRATKMILLPRPSLSEGGAHLNQLQSNCEGIPFDTICYDAIG